MENQITNLYFKSKKVSFLILAATAIVCSRALFFFFNDPEGPNLLIVTVFALAIYLLSIAAYVFGPIKIKGIERLSAGIGIQTLLVIGLYFCMK
jgi:VIT1/CCC1 family predicted Fe2+/Mn2+ transporter